MEEYQTPAPAKKAFFSKENLPMLIAIAASVVIVAVLAIVLLAGSGPKGVAKKYITTILTTDIEGRRKLLAYDFKEYQIDRYGDGDEEDFFEYMSDEYDEDITSWKDYCKVVAALDKESREDYYGKYKLVVEATTVKDLSAKKLESEVGESFFDRYEDYGVDADKISKGAVVTVKAKFDGEDESSKLTYKVYVAKIGLSWKVLSADLDSIK